MVKTQLNSWAIIPFSNAFSNAGDYVRSRLNAGKLKPQYSNQTRSPANVSELKTTAWHARGQGFESPYLHQKIPYATGCLQRFRTFLAAPRPLRQQFRQQMFERGKTWPDAGEIMKARSTNGRPIDGGWASR